MANIYVVFWLNGIVEFEVMSGIDVDSFQKIISFNFSQKFFFIPAAGERHLYLL